MDRSAPARQVRRPARRALAALIGAFVATTGIAAGPASADGATLTASAAPAVANGGFEEPAPGAEIPGWTVRYASDTGGFAVVDDALAGAQALRMEDPSDVDQIGLLSDPVAVQPGASYEVGAWARVETGVPSVVVYFYDDAGQRLADHSLRVREETGAWGWQGVRAESPDGAASVRVLLYSSTADLTRVTWDDVTVVRTALEVPNAGFEDPPIDGAVARWTPQYATGPDTFTVVPSPARSGAQALRMTDPSATDQVGLLSGAAPVTAGETYDVGVWALVERGIPSWVLYFYD